jgi:PAS domain S-box-containing protein
VKLTMNTSRDIVERSEAEEALQESEERSRSLIQALDTSQVGILILDSDLKVVWVNQALEKYLGLRREDLIGRKKPQLICDRIKDVFEDPETFAEKILATYRDGTCGEHFECHVLPDGQREERWLEHWSQPIHSGLYAGGRIEHYYDITRRKRAEDGVRESENKFRVLAEKSLVGVYIIQDGLFRYVNPRLAEIFGYHVDELIDKRGPKDLTVPEDWPLAEKNIRIRLSGEAESIHYGFRGISKTGQVLDIEVYGTRTTYQGRPAIIGTLLDMTERKRAEEELRRLATAVVQTAEAIIITDTEGTIQYVNPAFERITGYKQEEAVGRNPRILKSGKHDEAFYAHLWEVLTRGEVWSGHFINKKKDGTLYEAEVTISPVRDASGETVNYVAVQRDVSHQVELEEQLRQSQKMEAIGRLAGGVAHDFNNLLTAITGYTDILLIDLAEGDPLRDYLEQVQKAALRAAALTRQLLAFSRRQVLQPEVMDLNAAVADMEEMLRRLIGEDIDLITVLDPALGRVKADPGQIEQVIMNLAVNARDAMPRGGKLTIETANVELDEDYAGRHVAVRPGSYVMLAISDTGVGMTPEIQARIFEPFFTTKERGKGTGLGLSTVYGIVKQSGGNIWVYSEIGRGTTFKIYLPRVEGEIVSGDHTRAPIESYGGTETILLVEDDDLVRDLARRVLRKNGYTVLDAQNGGEALLLCEQHDGPIHLMVTDVVLPRMGARELAERLATLRPAMKVLYMSGYTDNAIVHHGTLDPGTAFLQKPFTPESLARKVREVLDAD